MNRKTQFLFAGAGGAVAFFAVRAMVRKKIKTLPYGYGIKLKQDVTVCCPASHLFEYWRNVENLSQLFENVLSVKAFDDRRSHWQLKVPGGINLEWDAEITVDRENEMIGWRSLDGADLDNAGSVRFEPAPEGGGTVVRVALQYNPPAGKLGSALATLLGEKPANQIAGALKKFKHLMEACDVSAPAHDKDVSHSVEPVDAASEDSFPASDPPAWTGTTGPVG